MPHTIQLSSLSGRFNLVPPTADDDEAVIVVRTEESTRRYLRYLPETLTLADVQTRRTTRNLDDTILDFHIHVAGEERKFAGMCGLFHISEENKSCEVGIVLSSEYHSAGFATETIYALLKYAFEDRGFHRAVFGTGIDNAPMRGWLEKIAGATLEATYRDCWLGLDGKYSDVVGYSLLEDEWRGMTKKRIEDKVAKRETGTSVRVMSPQTS